MTHSWHWQTWNQLPCLTCSLLDGWPHGFFTQHYAPKLPEDLTPILSSTAIAYRVQQVHGNTVLTPTEVSDWLEAQSATGLMSQNEPAKPPADGLITQQPQQAVWVCSADCTPALIADEETGQVAAVHAGWRGTAQKIIPQAIARLQAQGSQLQHLRIALGPAIAGENYQVSEQVAVEVGQSISAIAQTDLLTALAHLQALPNSPILPDSEPGRVRLDVRRVNAIQLEQLGINPEQVAISPHCTFADPDHFFSYRRIRQKKAQWSGIVSRG
jgi:polyphenol oxidase